jgi:hypothetical protein
MHLIISDVYDKFLYYVAGISDTHVFVCELFWMRSFTVVVMVTQLGTNRAGCSVLKSHIVGLGYVYWPLLLYNAALMRCYTEFQKKVLSDP